MTRALVVRLHGLAQFDVYGRVGSLPGLVMPGDRRALWLFRSGLAWPLAKIRVNVLAHDNLQRSALQMQRRSLEHGRWQQLLRCAAPHSALWSNLSPSGNSPSKGG